MPGRHKSPKRARSVHRWLVGAAALALAATSAGIGLLAAAPAGAAPNPSYHAGSDNATFTVTGVLDSNCLVSVGGTEIWIKPGDDINFDSSLVGISVSDALLGQTLGGLLGSLLKPSQVAGLNVSATIDPGKAGEQKVNVAGGKKTNFSSAGAHALSVGDHAITWNATGLALLPGLVHAPIALKSTALKGNGVSLSWSGVIHVTNDAPKCKLGVSTPKAHVKLGPVDTTVPQIDANIPGVTLPDKLPSIGDLIPKGHKPTGSKPGTGKPGANTGTTYTPPGLTIPDQVVPQDIGGVSGGGGFYGTGLPITGSNTDSLSPIFGNASDKAAGKSGADLPQQNSNGKNKSIDLAASNASPSGALPVVLAIVAIIALALVAGTYARLYLLRGDS